MSIDIFEGMIDAPYNAWGVEALFSEMTEGIIVLDKTSGVDVSFGTGKGHVPTLQPALCIRSRHAPDPGALVGQTVTLNSVTWKVVSHRPRPTPMGESKGELFLILRKVS